MRRKNTSILASPSLTGASPQQSDFAGGRSGCRPKVLVVLILSAAAAFGSQSADSSREQVIKIVTQIQRADYEGDRAALKRLHGELTPFVENKELASRVRYWRGFALWRRAINGFNDSIDAKVQEEDLKQAVDEFNQAASKDPGFVDAKIGAASCLTMIIFSLGKDPAG